MTAPPPTKLIITDYKNVSKYDKNAAIKCSYKPHGTKTPQSPLKVNSQTCCRRPQHNWVDAEWKSPLSNYLTVLWGRVERHVWANLSTSMKYVGRSGWQIRGERLTDSVTDRIRAFDETVCVCVWKDSRPKSSNLKGEQSSSTFFTCVSEKHKTVKGQKRQNVVDGMACPGCDPVEIKATLGTTYWPLE